MRMKDKWQESTENGYYEDVEIQELEKENIYRCLAVED
jgi:hypothetical protein